MGNSASNEMKTAVDEEASPDAVGVTVSNTKKAPPPPPPAGPPMTHVLSNLLAMVISVAIAVLVAAVLSSGESVIKLKHPSELPRLTALGLKSKGLDYRADELLGPSYGVGPHHDSSGTTWLHIRAGDTLQKYIGELGLYQTIAAVPAVIASDGLKHPAAFLSCHGLLHAGLSAMSFCIIAEVVAVLMVFFHALAAVGVLGKLGVSPLIAKALAVLVWTVLSLGFLIVCCLAIGIYETEWACANEFVPAIRLSDHFNYQWGFSIANVGFASTLLALFAMVFFTSKEGKAPKSHKMDGAKFLVCVVVGLVVGMVAEVVVAAANSTFVAPAPADPNVNPCAGQKPYSAGPGDNYFVNTECMKDGLVAVLEQAGANVTLGYQGDLDAGEWRVPIDRPYDQTELCPVNVHWHLGAEHLSVGQFDETGTGPSGALANSLPDGYCSPGTAGRQLTQYDDEGRRLASGCTRLGYRCKHYDAADAKFTTPYNWQHCTDMKVGETYEIHWPHSAAGACNTDWQYQTPFYDGVFCNDGMVNILTPLNTYQKIGVQSQTFTVVNDERYYVDNLIEGMIVGEDKGKDITRYTGSTTGTSRDNNVCSRYAPITWQVDRKCHMVSASSFDKLCQDMKAMKDDMSGDLYPHGSRELVADQLTANNQVFTTTGL